MIWCHGCTRVDGQNDPSPRSTSPLDDDLSSHHHATKSSVSTDQSAGMHCSAFMSTYYLIIIITFLYPRCKNPEG